MHQPNSFDSSARKEKDPWREKHDAYLQSSHWQDLRQRCFLQSNHRCEACRSQRHLEGHHLKYRTPLESGVLEDIMALCHRCHMLWHDYLRRNTLNLADHSREITATSIRIMLRDKSDTPKRKVKKSKSQRRRERAEQVANGHKIPLISPSHIGPR